MGLTGIQTVELVVLGSFTVALVGLLVAWGSIKIYFAEKYRRIRNLTDPPRD